MKVTGTISCILSLLIAGSSAASAEDKKSFKELFFDEDDGGGGAFDISGALATSAGFFPVPIIITEPAVGYGVGAALLFFHGSLADAEKKQQEAEARGQKNARVVPPSTSGVVGFGTENGTWGVGVFHAGYWKNDSIRYIGALFHADVNLGFYGRPEGELPEITYNLKSNIFLQQLLFRLGESDFFLGGGGGGYLFSPDRPPARHRH